MVILWVNKNTKPCELWLIYRPYHLKVLLDIGFH